MNNQSLVFQSTQFNSIRKNGQPWLQAAEIARALNYAREDAVSRIYDRNKDEFPSSMTETVKLTASGNYQKSVRIFSLRGAHLIAMFARTDKAKEFRKWVLDVLDNHVSQSTEQTAFQTAHEQALAYFNACRESVRAAGGILPEWPEPNSDVAKGLVAEMLMTTKFVVTFDKDFNLKLVPFKQDPSKTSVNSANLKALVVNAKKSSELLGLLEQPLRDVGSNMAGEVHSRAGELMLAAKVVAGEGFAY